MGGITLCQTKQEVYSLHTGVYNRMNLGVPPTVYSTKGIFTCDAKTLFSPSFITVNVVKINVGSRREQLPKCTF